MRTEVHAMPVRQALNRVRGMPFRWSLNPYRGCRHACAYCYARATHRFLDLSPDEDFSTVLFAKTNIADVLRQEVGRAGWDRDRVALGTATDPYQPLEGRYKLTRSCLFVLWEARTPVDIVTKGTLIVRDLDVLAQMAGSGLVRVWFSVPTVDREIWRRSEPGTPAPTHRLRALARLREAGVPGGVFLAPILPGITDDPTHLRQAVQAAKEAGALAVGGQLLRLASDVKPVYRRFLERWYPHLTAAYDRWYADGADASPALSRGLRTTLDRLRAEWGLARDLDGELPASQLTFGW
jgi:DNA repair photolyase